MVKKSQSSHLGLFKESWGAFNKPNSSRFKIVSHTQHEIKYATVWKQLMQTQRMLFLPSTGASQGSYSEHNPQSFVTKHELLKITGRWGRTVIWLWDCFFFLEGKESGSPFFMSREARFCTLKCSLVGGGRPQMFGPVVAPQMQHFQSHFQKESVDFSEHNKRRNLLAVQIENVSCNILPIFFLHENQRKANLRPIISGPRLWLPETRLSRYPCGDTVGTLNMKIRVMRS